MRRDLLNLISIVVTGVVGRFLFRQMVSMAIGKLADPLVRLFYAHAKAYATGLSHKQRSPVKCEDCELPLKSLPN